jgi:hypothetical protein
MRKEAIGPFRDSTWRKTLSRQIAIRQLPIVVIPQLAQNGSRAPQKTWFPTRTEAITAELFKVWH